MNTVHIAEKTIETAIAVAKESSSLSIIKRALHLYACNTFILFYTPLHVFPSECPSVVSRPCAWFPLSNSNSFSGFYSNFAFTCISGVSGLGLLTGKFRQYLTELSARHTSIFSFLDDNSSKHQLIFTKLGMCMIWF